MKLRWLKHYSRAPCLTLTLDTFVMSSDGGTTIWLCFSFNIPVFVYVCVSVCVFLFVYMHVSMIVRVSECSCELVYKCVGASVWVGLQVSLCESVYTCMHTQGSSILTCPTVYPIHYWSVPKFNTMMVCCTSSALRTLTLPRTLILFVTITPTLRIRNGLSFQMRAQEDVLFSWWSAEILSYYHVHHT